MTYPIKDTLPKILIRTLVKSMSVLALACIFINSISGADGDTPTAGGTVIVNRADATYEDADGKSYSTVSPTVRVTVSSVPAVTVTPDETAPSDTIAPNDRVTRLFKICNSGNVEDFFIPTHADISSPAAVTNVYFDTDNSGTITPGDTPVQINLTLTPRLAPRACLGVLFAVDTNGVTPQSQISINLTAKSTLPLPGSANNFAEDSGKIINVAGNAVIFTSPSNTSLPPVKLVQNVPQTTATAAQVLNYSISFRNAGSVTARQIRLIDDLPAGLEYVANTLRLNNLSLTDASDTDKGTATARRIELLIPEIAPGAVTLVQFQARLTGVNVNGNGVINAANISAANAAPVRTSNAVAVINPFGTVYAGNSGGATRVGGAQVTVASDENGTPLNLALTTGYAPNSEN